MAESDRRHKYVYNRVLIETARVLDPQFDDAVVFLSGAQIELLRNVTQYLNRRATYVSEEFLGYYLAPTVADYDEILAIVADMEESLMGNPNTIWGYKGRWSEHNEETSIGAGFTDVSTDVVPAGYVYSLEYFAVVHEDVTTRYALVNVLGGDAPALLYEAPSMPAGVYAHELAPITLMSGDYIRLRVYGLANTKVCTLRVWGTMMQVPE